MIVSDETSSINNQHSFQPRSPDYPSSPQVIKVAHYSVRDGFLPRLYLLTIFPLLLFSIGGIQVIVVTGTVILECGRQIVIESLLENSVTYNAHCNLFYFREM